MFGRMNMKNKTWTVLSLLLAITITTASGKGTAPHDIDCSDSPDGLHEIGCWGYANCLDGQPIINQCGSDLVFDRNSMTCVRPGTTNTDCFLPVDCSGKPDASYPDYADSCVTYYRCIDEKNLGRFYCPAQTAFNEKLQICDYPWNILAPCGALMRPATTTTTTTTTQAPITTTTQKPTTTIAMKTTFTPTMMTTTTPMMTTTTMMMTTMTTPAATTAKAVQTSQMLVMLTSDSSRKPLTTKMAAAPSIPIVIG